MQTGHKKQAQAEQVLRSSCRKQGKTKAEAEQKAKQEKNAAQRQENLKRSQKAAEKRRQEMELAYRKQTMVEALANPTMETNRFTYTATSEVISSVATAFEKNIMGATGILQ